MGYDPDSNTLHELTPEFLAKFPTAKNWPKFREGQIVAVRPQEDFGKPFTAKFRIAEIGENRMVLIAVGAPTT